VTVLPPVYLVQRSSIGLFSTATWPT